MHGATCSAPPAMQPSCRDRSAGSSLAHASATPPLPAAMRRECVGLWTNTFGDLLQEEKIEWRGRGEGSGRLLERPICWLPFLGCVYL